jgi:hypothetical protein
MNPKHLVLSVDYDGTLNWRDTNATNFVSQNTAIINTILGIIRQKNYETVTIISGSARQNYAIEKAGSYLPPNHDTSQGYVSPLPSTAGFSLLVKALNKELGEKRVRLNRSLLCDLHAPTQSEGEINPNTTFSYFNLIKRNIERLKNNRPEINCADSLNDTSKFLLLTWQMDYFSALIQGYSLHNNHIDFYFIDDLGPMNQLLNDSNDLITPLVSFFQTYPREIPNNVTFHAIEACCDPADLNPHFQKPVTGKGFSCQTIQAARDNYFQRAVQAMQHMPVFRNGHINTALIQRVTATTFHQTDLFGITNSSDFLTGYKTHLLAKENTVAPLSLFSVNAAVRSRSTLQFDSHTPESDRCITRKPAK